MSVVLAKTDSEVSSLTPSSPTRSPSSRRPVYYVQSPSRDSHDGEKTTNSFHSSPVLSPMGSPPHSHSNSSLGPHSRDSSSTRFSASVKPGSRKPANHKIPKPWKRFDAIEEERLLDDDGASDGFTRRCYFLAFVIGFVVLFSLFSLILWGASRPQKPTILMKVSPQFSFSFSKFRIGNYNYVWVMNDGGEFGRAFCLTSSWSKRGQIFQGWPPDWWRWMRRWSSYFEIRRRFSEFMLLPLRFSFRIPSLRLPLELYAIP